MRFLLTVLVLLGIVSCSKKSEKPGQLFECHVNGAEWRPKGNISQFFTAALALNSTPTLQVEYTEAGSGNNQLQIHTSRYRRVGDSLLASSFKIFLPNISAASSYPLTNITASPMGLATFQYKTEENCSASNLYPTAVSSGTVNIHYFSRSERRVAGTFSFQFPGCGGIAVTNGRFDLVY